MTMQPPIPEMALSPEHNPELEAMKDKLRSIEVPVEVNEALAKLLLKDIELLNDVPLSIGKRSRGQERFSMSREGGDRIFVPSIGDKQLLPVFDDEGKRVRAGYLTGLLGVYLKCQRAANLGGNLPKKEFDDKVVEDSRVAAIYALVDAIALSLGSPHYEVSASTIETVGAYVRISAPNQDERATSRAGEKSTADVITKIVPVLREVIK